MFSVDYDDQGTIRLVGDATVREAEALRETLRVAVAEKRPAWTLDLAALDSVDTCTAQVLVAFKRTVPSFRAHSCTKGVRDFLAMTGLAEHLL